jgi:conjugative transfer signal peptidase TraF
MQSSPVNSRGPYDSSPLCSPKKSRPSLRDRLLRLLGGVALLAMAIAAARAGLSGHLLINFTPSIPRGVYWINTGHRPSAGDLVAFPVPEHVRELVYQREYVPRHIGLLSKPVVAIGGDRVCAHPHTFEVNGQVAGNTLQVDRAGNPMPRYAGCGVLTATQIFVATTHDQSFDSRYFGPIELSAVRGTLSPLLTF